MSGGLTLISDPFVQTSIFISFSLLNILLLIVLFLMRRRMKLFLRGKDGLNLENLISKSSNDIVQLHLNMAKISHILEKQEKELASTIKKVGVVRFNPFNNTGGDQSFAIALLDSENSGVVVSSLYLREGARVYAKPISKLKSNYPLSGEEEEAIKKAVG